jgi:hypothetical protein
MPLSTLRLRHAARVISLHQGTLQCPALGDHFLAEGGVSLFLSSEESIRHSTLEHSE